MPSKTKNNTIVELNETDTSTEQTVNPEESRYQSILSQQLSELSIEDLQFLVTYKKKIEADSILTKIESIKLEIDKKTKELNALYIEYREKVKIDLNPPLEQKKPRKPRSSKVDSYNRMILFESLICEGVWTREQIKAKILEKYPDTNERTISAILTNCKNAIHTPFPFTAIESPDGIYYKKTLEVESV